MGLSNREYYKLTMEQYKKNANRLIRTVNNLSIEIEKYEKEQLETLSDIEEFSDVISLIQNRPKFGDIELEHIKLPEINMEDLKIESKASKKLLAKYKGPEIGVSGLLVTPEIESYGILGHDIPFLENSALGCEVEMFFDKIIGTGIMQLAGKKESDKIGELSRVIDDIEKNVDETVPKLETIKSGTNSLYNSLKRTRNVYDAEFEVVKNAVKRTRNYSEFQKIEQVALKNTVMLIGILYQMCKVKLIKKSNARADQIEMNEEIHNCNENSMVVVAQVNHNYEAAQLANTSSLDIIDEQIAVKENHSKVMTMDIADKINIHQNYVCLDECVAYFDENSKEIKVIYYDTLNIEVLSLKLEFDNMHYRAFGGSNNEIYFTLAEKGVNKFYEYSLTDKKLSCIYSSEQKSTSEQYYLQCNKNFVVYVCRKGEYPSDGYELNIYDIDNKEMIHHTVYNIQGYILEQDDIFINHDYKLYRYSIKEQSEVQIGKMDGYGMMSFIDSSESVNVKIEGEKLYSWATSSYSADEGTINIIEINLNTNKRKKYHIKDSCEMVGTYHNGYVYYIRCDREDSLCRYNLLNKKKETLVEQTDCAISATSGFLKKSTRYFVREEDVGLQIINGYLYYYTGMQIMDNGSVMRVELNNEFLLSEIN